MKFKLTVVTVKEFETNLSDYPEYCKTPEDARALEQAMADDDPFLSSDGGDTTAIVELIRE